MHEIHVFYVKSHIYGQFGFPYVCLRPPPADRRFSVHAATLQLKHKKLGAEGWSVTFISLDWASSWVDRLLGSPGRLQGLTHMMLWESLVMGKSDPNHTHRHAWALCNHPALLLILCCSHLLSMYIYLLSVLFCIFVWAASVFYLFLFLFLMTMAGPLWTLILSTFLCTSSAWPRSLLMWWTASLILTFFSPSIA